MVLLNDDGSIHLQDGYGGCISMRAGSSRDNKYSHGSCGHESPEDQPISHRLLLVRKGQQALSQHVLVGLHFLESSDGTYLIFGVKNLFRNIDLMIPFPTGSVPGAFPPHA
jgi:hypothetical protein